MTGREWLPLHDEPLRGEEAPQWGGSVAGVAAPTEATRVGCG